ncbi:hypothetical protein D3C72_2598690 [compost metagenome]
MYQMPIIAKSTGMFCSNGALAKCWSMMWAPLSSSVKFSSPRYSMIGSPIADHRL